MDLKRIKDNFRQIEWKRPLKKLWARVPEFPGRSSLILAALLAFFSSALLSFVLFREWGFSLSVKLANVQFQDQLAQSLTIDSQLKPARSWDVTSGSGGKVGPNLLFRSGDLVKRDQIVAILNEAENRAALESALQNFKTETEKRAKAQAQDTSAETEFLKRKLELEAAKRKLESGLVRSPAEGYLWLGNIQLGTLLREGDRLASIEDLTSYIIHDPMFPAATGHEITQSA